MSRVEQPRGRADSIPGLQLVLAEPYRDSPSSLSSPEAHPVVHADPATDCLADEKPTPSIDPPPPESRQPPAQDDEMLSVPRADGGLPVPALPAKSALRRLRLLASLAQKAAPEDRPMLPHAAPHQVYLSSEEDASSSADDLSGLDELDWEADEARQSAKACRREDTARVVTVVFHGRPSIVDLPPRGCAAMTEGRRPATGILRTATEPTLTRTRSSSASAAGQNPPRSTSMTPSGFQARRRQFLTIDPFAARQSEPDEQDAAKTPKTPSAMLKKTLSLVKKRSKPTLNPAGGHSRESLALPTPPMEQVGEEPEPDTPRQTPPPPVTYQGIMRVAAGKTGVASPTTNAGRSRFRGGLSISRPRSVRV